MGEIGIETGKKIFESVPAQLIPIWAGQILLLFNNYVKKVPIQISELYVHINDHTEWKRAHGQFTAIRILHLETPNFEPTTYLILAEKVAKVVYNASGQPAPFDADSGWYIPQLAIDTAKELESKELLNKLDQLFDLFINAPHLKRKKNLKIAKDMLFELIEN